VRRLLLAILLVAYWPLGGIVVAQNTAGGFDTRLFAEGMGLSSSFVVGTLESPEGRLLVATKFGLKLFDGRTFTPVLFEDGNVDNVSVLYRSGDTIYLGLTDGNILVYKNRILTKLTTGLDEQIKFIHFNKKSGLTVVSRSGKLVRLKDGKPSEHELLPGESLVNAVVMPKEGQLIVGTNEGAYDVLLNPDGSRKSLKKHDLIPSTRVMALEFVVSKDLVWLATEDAGLFRLSDVSSDRPTVSAINLDQVQNQELTSVKEDSKGRVWLGVRGSGLHVFELKATGSAASAVHTLSDPAIQQHEIIGMYEDSEGTLWVSTLGGGLVQVLDLVFDHPFDADWLRQQRITQLFRDSKEQTWIGIDKGIFLAQSVDGLTQFKYFHLGGQTVTSVSEDPNNTLWVGTESNGVYRKLSKSDDFVQMEWPDDKLTSSVNAIVIGKDRINVCTKGGLFILDLSGRTLNHIRSEEGLPHNNVLWAHTDPRGNTWIANQGNRVSFIRDGKVNFLEDRDAQNITDVQHIIEDRKGRLWFATLGSGVFILDNGTANQIGESEGLPSGYCYQLVEDDNGNIWVKHQKSISQISTELRVERVIGHQHLSPVANTMITFISKDAQGNLWITSTHGVVRYNPLIDISRRKPPHLSILGMRLDDEPVKMVSGLTLSYKQYNVSFDISGVSFRDPENISYKYRLLGFSDVWSDPFSSHVIQFPRLEDGTYTLEVIASKNDGAWTPVPATYSFTINKPFWRTWPFILVAFIAITAGVVSFVRYRTVKLMADKVELESLVSERTIEIQQQKEQIEKSRDEIARYAKDVTDSIKYAQRIQSAIFPEWESMASILPDSFVFFRSKDIVSGDFYFAEKAGDLRIFAAVDCTGHGVPGGFMSIVANNLLNQAVKQMGLTRPSEILDYLNEGITNTLHQTYEESSVKDGLDIAICTLNPKNRKLEFAGAYNPLYVFRNQQLTTVRGDRFPVGMFVGEEIKSFTNHTIQLEPDDVVYIFSDGFADQFGGSRGKKLKLNGFRELLLNIHRKPMKEQEHLLALKLKEWMGDLDQVDDILVIGVHIS
jgi:ligand-binding sensor domain-containing protein/serine phosphatase RsbU (regulator of sigma subunit)